MSTTASVRRILSSPQGLLQAGYASGLVFTTVLTLLAAHLLSTSDFASVTKALIISAVVPLLASWGVPDAVTFTALRNGARTDHGVVGLALTGCLSIIAVGIAVPYAWSQGLTWVEATLTASISALAIVGMTCQAVELIHNKNGRVATMAAAPSVVALLVFLPMMTGGATATEVLMARVIGSAVTTGTRLVMLRRHLPGRLSWPVAREILVGGTPIYVSSILAAGSLRLEQALVLHFFPQDAIAAYGLVLPVVNGIRTLLYGAGTAVSVELARSKNNSLLTCHRRAAPLAGFAACTSVISAVAVIVISHWVGLDSWLSPLAAFGFVLGGALSGVIDVLVRMYRGSGDARYGVASRTVGLITTATAGPFLISAGVGTGSVTGLVSGSLAYLVLLTGALRKERT